MNREKEIKDTITGAYEFIENDTDSYKIKIISRGEELFFQKGKDALICEVSARYALINPKTIKKWDNGAKIDDEERVFVLGKIIELYKKAYKDELEIFTN